MITKEYVYKKAFLQQKESLKERQMKYDIMLSSVYKSEPRLKEIDNRLNFVGAQLALTALSGDKNKLSLLRAEASDLGKEKKEILKKAGIKDFQYKCDICNDSGYVSYLFRVL